MMLDEAERIALAVNPEIEVAARRVAIAEAHVPVAGALDDRQNRGRFLEIILEHSRRLARLTDDLLKLSEMDADRERPSGRAGAPLGCP